jgi:hypothetical protein
VAAVMNIQVLLLAVVSRLVTLLRNMGRWCRQCNLKNLNYVAWVCECAIQIERPPLVGEASANFCGRRVLRGQRDGSIRPYSRLSRPEPLLFLPSSSSIVLTRLSGPRSRPTTSQKIR